MSDSLESCLSQCPIKIQISNDAMKATVDLPQISFSYSKLQNPQPLKDFEKRLLEEAAKLKIIFGLKEVTSHLKNWVEYRKPVTLVLAEGRAVVPGKPAKMEVLFREGTAHKPSDPKKLRELSFVIHVPQKTLLARYTKAVEGQAGKKITGQEAPAAKVTARPPQVSSLIQQVEDNGIVSYWSTQDCMLEKLSDDSVLVTDHLQIAAQIDYHTGNIDAWGSVTIKGSVTPNFKVKATGDVIVQGVIENAYIECAGTVKATSILGNFETTYVKAGKNIEVQFLQNCQVQAGGDVLVKDSVFNSEVISGGKIEVLGGKGAVVAGKLMAGACVHVLVLGSHGENALRIKAGVNPVLWKGLERQKRELQFSRRLSLKGSYRSRKKISRLAENLMTRQYKKRTFSTILERSIARKENAVLNDLMSKQELPYVKAERKVYANIHIQIGPYRIKTIEETGGKTFQPDVHHGIIVSE